MVSGARTRTWNYQVDAVGNVTQIDDELACGTQDLVLSDQTVATTEVFESCADLTVGPDFHVAAPADVTLRAAGGVGFENVVSVESGAVLRVEPGADLGPPQLSTRTFGYQDFQYYLTLADGPWGAYDWTYDRIGNRLSEDDDGTLDTYDYEANAATTPGNLSRLDQIQLGVGGIRDYTFGTAGHLDQVAAGANVVNFTSDSEGRLAGLERLGNTAAMRYDGRSFLERVDEGGSGNFVEPTYSSEGTLFSLFGSDDGGATTGRRHVLYFSSRPVAILKVPSSGAETCTFLSADHLGTPFVASDDFGVEVWSGGFEPFGRDWLAGTPEGAQENGIFLRFPGQWLDTTWEEASLGAEIEYNQYRWYEFGNGTYTKQDPLGLDGGGFNLFSYALGRPTAATDPMGQAVKFSPSCDKVYGANAAAIKETVQAAAEAADAGGKACLACPERDKFEDRIRDLTIKCVSWNKIPGTNIRRCGMAGEFKNGKVVPFTDTIILTPNGVNTNAAQGCFCLPAIIMHEVLHFPDLRGPGHSNNAMGVVSRCFKTCRAQGGAP